MTNCERSSFNRPFARLKQLMNEKNIVLEPHRATNNTICANLQESARYDDGELLFLKAMSGVKPMVHDKHFQTPQNPTRNSYKQDTEENETEELEKLRLLVDKGKGFLVHQTGEYQAATGPGVPVIIAENIHNGKFAIQDWIDLHGCTLEEARVKFNEFIKKAIVQSKQSILIIHGRGLKSKNMPVLKNAIFQWLTTGHWRKWVIALASARLCDGGSGATHVLLRQSPLTKKDLRTRTGTYS